MAIDENEVFSSSAREEPVAEHESVWSDLQGVPFAQGYLFSRPLNVTDATALLSAPPARFETDDRDSPTFGPQCVLREAITS